MKKYRRIIIACVYMYYFQQLRDPTTAMSTYQANVITENAPIVTKITSEVNSRYAQLQKQHQDFVGHLRSQLQSFTQQIKSQIEALQSSPASTAPSKFITIYVQNMYSI